MWDFVIYSWQKKLGTMIWLCDEKTEDNGMTEVITSANWFFSIYNNGDHDGYVHIIIENKIISSYPMVSILFFSILGSIWILRKKVLIKYH